ncbi:MAG: helix-turn-helix domain-containing protein [Moorellales bacterium]
MARRPKAPWVPEVSLEELSPQQKAIAELIEKGKTVNEIAAELGVGERTIRKQLERIRKAIMTTRDLNTESRPVSHAHRPPEEDPYAIEEIISTVLTADHLSLQAKTEMLTQFGHFSCRALAEHLGTTRDSVYTMRTRMRAALARGKTVRRMATAEEIAALSAKSAEDPSVVAGLAYEVYVIHGDSLSPDAQAARKLLAAVGGGGPQIRKIAFSDRARMLKRLLAERKRLMKVVGRNVYWLVRDVLEQEFVPMSDGILRPRRRLSWEALRAVLEERFRAITAVNPVRSKVGLEEAGVREGLPVYELKMGWDGPVAAAVRQMGQAYLVARADRLEGSAERVAAGRLEQWSPAGGRAVVAAEAGRIEAECTGIAVRHRGCLWSVSDPRLARPGDAVEVVGTYLVVRGRDLRLVVLCEGEVARLAAWFMAGKDCFVRVWEPAADGGDSWREFRCALPGAEKVMLVDVDSLDWEEAARRERAELEAMSRGGREGRSDPRSRPVRVKPQEDRSRYRVVAGALRVAEAVERGTKQVPAVVELPQR